MRPDPPAAPDPVTRPPLDEAALRRALVVDGGLWTTLQVVDSTGSTNADLAEEAHRGAAEGRVLVAEHQHHGRGRAGRSWSTPPRAGLAVSVLLRPGAGGARTPVPVTRWSWLPLLAGVALAEAVVAVTALSALLKWPNDLLVGGRKCAGILSEVVGDAVVLGTGLNVTQRADELPAPAPGALPATSLALAGAHHTDREALVRELLRRLDSWYLRWCAAAGDAEACGLRAAYLAASDTVGRPVRALLPGGGKLVGDVTTVDLDGRLVLRAPDGGSHTVAAGDIAHLRAA